MESPASCEGWSWRQRAEEAGAGSEEEGGQGDLSGNLPQLLMAGWQA